MTGCEDFLRKTRRENDQEAFPVTASDAMLATMLFM